MADERHRVLFSGRVQGVGFRYTAARISSRFDVRGFVRNLSDGRVELLAEGSPTTIDAFLQAIQIELDDKIHNISIEREPIDEPRQPGFEITW